jgi:hypothetical protein
MGRYLASSSLPLWLRRSASFPPPSCPDTYRKGTSRSGDPDRYGPRHRVRSAGVSLCASSRRDDGTGRRRHLWPPRGHRSRGADGERPSCADQIRGPRDGTRPRLVHPKYDSVPSGELSIPLDHVADGERRSFSPTQELDLEADLPDVLKALVKIAMRLRADRNRQDDTRRRNLEAAELWRQEEQRRRRERTSEARDRARHRRDLLRQSVRPRQATSVGALFAWHSAAKALRRFGGGRTLTHTTYTSSNDGNP